MTLPEQIQQLDDFKALRFYEHLSSILFNSTEVDAQTLMQYMPASDEISPVMQQIQAADETFFDNPLENKQAIAFARKSLEVLSSNPSTAAFVSHEIDNWKDNSMIAGTILAIGGAISLYYLALYQ